MNKQPAPMKLLIRGNALRETDDKEGALKAYTEAIALDPTFDSAYYNRAAVLVALSRDEEAIADLKVLLKLQSPLGKQLQGMFRGASAGHVSIGNNAFASGDLDTALQQYRKAALFDPENPDPHIGLGIVHAKKGELPMAIEAYDRAVQLDPKSATAYHNRAIVRMKQSEFALALADFSKACELEPEQPSNFGGRADAYDRLGDKVNAEKDRGVEASLKAKAKDAPKK